MGLSIYSLAAYSFSIFSPFIIALSLGSKYISNNPFSKLSIFLFKYFLILGENSSLKLTKNLSLHSLTIWVLELFSPQYLHIGNSLGSKNT